MTRIVWHIVFFATHNPFAFAFLSLTGALFLGAWIHEELHERMRG